MSNFDVIDAGDGRFIKAWRRGVPFEDKAVEQLKNTAKLPFIYKYIAAMPDTHWGMGATIGTVLPTKGAVVPSAVGVDIGCGMMAVRTGLKREAFGDVSEVRRSIESAVPCGRTNNGGVGDRGAWGEVPADVVAIWDAEFRERYESLCERHPGAKARNTFNHLGTLGTGNHFIELAQDESGNVWIVLHSGSRGMGNKIGTYFTGVAKELCAKWYVTLPDPDLAYLPEGTQEFHDYRHAVTMAQEFAWRNRIVMMGNIFKALESVGLACVNAESVHCHHNYIAWERHFGENVIVTRKGAVRAQKDDLGIIPGSMGARTYIVRGLGNQDSFCTCSHGAGRAMGRREAERRFTLEDHARATEGVECAKDASVLDETPGAYKDIEAVMAAQADLVEPVYRLKQFVCVKGGKD
jgi:tRNA-splicing ligase RtcB (3'-phosphate/5'-hydroxy nucleic acid ligase)